MGKEEEVNPLASSQRARRGEGWIKGGMLATEWNTWQCMRGLGRQGSGEWVSGQCLWHHDQGGMFRIPVTR